MYIRRMDAIESLGEEPLVWCDEPGEIQARNDWVEYRAALESIPPADVAEVVRCKDCLHYHAMILDKDTGELAGWGICDQPWFNSDEYDVAEDGYCQDGVKRRVAHWKPMTAYPNEYVCSYCGFLWPDEKKNLCPS